MAIGQITKGIENVDLPSLDRAQHFEHFRWSETVHASDFS
jgi:hypothetical protein